MRSGKRKKKLGSLFTGVGGLDLGLHRGLGGDSEVELLFQCEREMFRLAILAKRFPGVARFRDVRLLDPRSLPDVDVLAFGFPCKNVSSAGKREGIKRGKDSKLWFEGLRIAAAKRPAICVVENVTSGAKLWLPQVRGDLHVLGYDSHALGVSAFDCGAPHMRRRVFVVAWRRDLVAAPPDADERAKHVQPGGRIGSRGEEEARARRSRGTGASADADGLPERESNQRTHAVAGRRALPREVSRGRGAGAHAGRTAADAEHEGRLQPEGSERAFWRWARDGGRWFPRPPVAGVCGVDDGSPSRLDRLAALGDAVVVPCAEAVGRYVRFEVLPRLRGAA